MKQSRLGNCGNVAVVVHFQECKSLFTTSSIIFAVFSVSSLTWCTGSVVLLDVHVFCYFTIDFPNNDPMHHLLFAMVYQRLCALRRVCFRRYTVGRVAFDTDSRAFPRW